MKKKTLFLLIALLFNLKLFAQHHQISDKDTVLYYIDKHGWSTTIKDSADYLLITLPADTSSGIKVYPVVEYYKDMKIKLEAYSRNQQYDHLKFEGTYADFYPDGKNKTLFHYTNGILLGKQIRYYPNGKFYSEEFISDDYDIRRVNCQDSTGKVLATGGNGDWIEYDKDFKTIIAKGAVKDSLKDGTWIENYEGTITTVFKKGVAISSSSKSVMLGDQAGMIFDVVQQVPLFKGDFGQYLAKTVRYPALAAERHQQGKVVVGLIVERDGSLSELKVIKSSASVYLDNEAVRVLRISPNWVPGMINNHPVRVRYSVPISFTLSNE